MFTNHTSRLTSDHAIFSQFFYFICKNNALSTRIVSYTRDSMFLNKITHQNRFLYDRMPPLSLAAEQQPQLREIYVNMSK